MVETLASTIYTDGGTSVNYGRPNRVHFRGITFRKSGAIVVMCDQVVALANQIAFENCGVDMNGTSNYTSWINRTGRMWFIDCVLDPSFTALLTDRAKESNCVVLEYGNTGYYGPAITYNALGNKGAGMARPAGDTVKPAAQGCLLAWNHLISTGNVVEYSSGPAISARGVGLVSNIFDTTTGITGPTFRGMGDGNTTPVMNAVMMCNAVVGSRTNWPYRHTGTPAHRHSRRAEMGHSAVQRAQGDQHQHRPVELVPVSWTPGQAIIAWASNSIGLREPSLE